jgi:hypothetical protein
MEAQVKEVLSHYNRPSLKLETLRKKLKQMNVNVTSKSLVDHVVLNYRYEAESQTILLQERDKVEPQSSRRTRASEAGIRDIQEKYFELTPTNSLQPQPVREQDSRTRSNTSDAFQQRYMEYELQYHQALQTNSDLYRNEHLIEHNDTLQGLLQTRELFRERGYDLSCSALIRSLCHARASSPVALLLDLARRTPNQYDLLNALRPHVVDCPDDALMDVSELPQKKQYTL